MTSKSGWANTGKFFSVSLLSPALFCAPVLTVWECADLNAELIPACSDSKYTHPADQLLLEIVTLFDKCKDARTAAQQQLPLSM